MWEGKPTTDEKNKEGSSQKLTDVALDLIKDVTPAIQTNGDVKPLENPPTVAKVGDGPITKPVVVLEKKVIPNGVANGC